MSSKKELLLLKIDPELKKQVTALFSSLGLDLSTATSMFYKQALRCHGLPFKENLDEPNEDTYAAMAATEKMEELYGPFDSVTDLFKALNS